MAVLVATLLGHRRARFASEVEARPNLDLGRFVVHQLPQRFLLRQAGELENRPLQAGFERLIAVDGHNDQGAFTGLAIDVMTPLFSA